MKPVLADYVVARLRRPLPAEHVVPGSTPVLSFGNASDAAVATLGLNPSRQEFLDRNGRELSGTARRFETLASLGVPSLASASRPVLHRVVKACNGYFAANPYRRWFDQLEIILNSCGVSYYNGTACHLDLVQWATDPTWGRLEPKSVRHQLLDADATFLLDQLSNENIKLLLVNGSGVIRQLKRSFNTQLNEADPIVGYGHHDTRLFTGTICGGVQVVAWSTNLQSSFGVSTALKTELATQVAALIAATIVA